MQIVLTQFFFRLALGAAIAMGVMPAKFADRRGLQIVLCVLAGAGAVATLAVYTQGTEHEHWGSVVFMASAISAIAGVAGLLGAHKGDGFFAAAFGTLVTLGLMGAFMATPWSQETSLMGLSLGAVDLASCGLLLGVTMSAELLGLWHLNTPHMQMIPWKVPLSLMVSAAVIRTVLCIVGLGIGAGQDLTWLFWVFLGSRWLMATLGLAMLALFARESGKMRETQQSTGLLFTGLFIATLGELGSQLVSVDVLYPV